MKKISLIKLGKAITKADQFRKYLIQEGVKQLLGLYKSDAGMNPLLIKFLRDCDIFEDEEETSTKNIDAIKPCALFEISWDYSGLQNNKNFFGTQRDWNESIVPIINKLSGLLGKTNNKMGNAIVVHPENAFIIEDLAYFHSDYVECEKHSLTVGDCKEGETYSSVNITKLGQLKNKYLVICNSSIVGKGEMVICRSNFDKQSADIGALVLEESYCRIIITNLHEIGE